MQWHSNNAWVGPIMSRHTQGTAISDKASPPMRGSASRSVQGITKGLRFVGFRVQGLGFKVKGIARLRVL